MPRPLIRPSCFFLGKLPFALETLAARGWMGLRAACEKRTARMGARREGALIGSGYSAQYTAVMSLACVGAFSQSPRTPAFAIVGIASWKR